VLISRRNPQNIGLSVGRNRRYPLTSGRLKGPPFDVYTNTLERVSRISEVDGRRGLVCNVLRTHLSSSWLDHFLHLLSCGGASDEK